eukprot:GHVS01089700.1.p2 GENE.GHVS01089700.1~~GHVS01089700.1.p2  ORF type:complete len:148 (+),score=8.08 GHVS01089700.1:189-632(+)
MHATIYMSKHMLLLLMRLLRMFVALLVFFGAVWRLLWFLASLTTVCVYVHYSFDVPSPRCVCVYVLSPRCVCVCTLHAQHHHVYFHVSKFFGLISNIRVCTRVQEAHYYSHIKNASLVQVGICQPFVFPAPVSSSSVDRFCYDLFLT